MADSQRLKRVAYSPGEFAELFGKSQTWGYRQIYAGKVTAITKLGRILIPAKEVERVLESAGIYNGPETPKKAKIRIQEFTPEQDSIWRRFLVMRRSAGSGPPAESSPPPQSESEERSSRKTSLGRIAAGWGRKSKPH